MEGGSLVVVIGSVAALAHESKPLLESGAKLIDNLLGEPFKVAGGMLSDQVYCWRIQRMAKIAAKAKKMLEAAGVEPRALPPGFLIPFLEASSVCDGEDLENLFAKILASSVSDDLYQHPVFRYAASQMNSDEIHVVAYLMSKPLAIYAITQAGQKYATPVLADVSDIPLAEPMRGFMYVENLQRLGLVVIGTLYETLHTPVPPHIESDPEFQRYASKSYQPPMVSRSHASVPLHN